MNPLDNKDECISNKGDQENLLRKAQKGGRSWRDGRNQGDLKKIPLHLGSENLQKYAEKKGRDITKTVKGTPSYERSVQQILNDRYIKLGIKN